MSARVIVCVAVLAAVLVIGSPIMAQDDGPTALVYGQTVDDRIDNSQPSVFYSFEAATGDVITITMIVTEGDVDPFLVLNDADRAPLSTDDNSGGGTNARLTYTIPSAGTYIIQATHAGGVPPENGGSFSLNLTAAVDDAGAGTDATPAVSDAPQIEGDSVRLVSLSGTTTVRDTLTRQVAVRYYWFSAATGDQLTITPEQLAGFQPLIALYDAGFNELQRTTPGNALAVRFEEAGIFFVAVSLPDTGSAGGGYGFVFNLTLNPAQRDDFINVAYGDSQQGTIDGSTPSVVYRFRGSTGDTVTVNMSRAGGDLNSYLYLLDEGGQLLFEDNDSGGQNGNASMSYTLPADGLYLVVATRLGQNQGLTSGSFLLELLSDAPAQAVGTDDADPDDVGGAPVLPAEYAELPQISYGETVGGELSSARFMDFYVFLGAEGDPITVEMISLNSDATNGLDPTVILLDEGRIPLGENDDIVDGVQRDSRLEMVLPATGYYAVVATRFEQDAGTSAGPYELTLTGPSSSTPVVTDVEDTPLSALPTVALNSGSPVQSTFDGGARLYSFSGTSTTLVDVAVTTDEGLDSVLVLADANLNEVLSSGTGALTGITLPKTSRYLVLLAPRFGPVDTAGGGYIIALTQGEEGAAIPSDPTVPLPVELGREVTGVINNDLVSRLYSFEGAAGDSIVISMEAAPGSALDCYVELQDADGAILDANDDIEPGVIRDSQIVTELPADGLYIVVASRYVGDDATPTTGAFVLRVDSANESGSPITTDTGGGTTEIVPLAYGRTEVGEISDAQVILFYVFDGTAGDVVTVEINNLNGNLDSVLHLYQSVGQGWAEIVSNDDSPIGGTYEALLSDVILPQTGKYLIAVSRYGLERETSYGTFTITLTRK